MKILSFVIGGALISAVTLAAAQTTETPRIFTGSNSTQTVQVQQQGTGMAIKGVTGSNAPAILGQATNTSGVTYGLWGVVSSSQGTGVRGESNATTGGAGVVGISHGSPDGTGGGSGVFGLAMDSHGVGIHGKAASADGSIGVLGEADPLDNIPIAVMGHITASCCGIAGLFENDVNTGNGGSGNESIIVGQTADTSNPGTQKTVFNLTTNGNLSITGQFTSGGADFAESVAVKGVQSSYTAGDVLVIDDTAQRRLAHTTQPYSRLVAGIYSTQPGMVGGVSVGKVPGSHVPLAVVGIVPCKVTAVNGPIKAGDLLVTSAKPGYAMRGTDPSRLTGAILGKALQPLPNGEGVIQVLVTLQ
ncbi:MAG TPA: hypothetical protein VE054_11830 [Blattabacteriaceae bacterium]|jgi:hypothetical protein|nr:hypothetical protein [Blattabacteriaceae bacterium]